MICTDQQRFQQVLLNLIYNSLKFTLNCGFVKIKVKQINSREDLSFPDENIFIQKQ